MRLGWSQINQRNDITGIMWFCMRLYRIFLAGIVKLDGRKILIGLLSGVSRYMLFDHAESE